MEELKKIAEQWDGKSSTENVRETRICTWIRVSKMIKGRHMNDENGGLWKVLDVFEDYDVNTGSFSLYITIRNLINRVAKVVEFNEILDWYLHE